MKKTIALMASLAMVILSIAGCGKSKYADSEYVGTWTAKSAEAAGVEISMDTLFDSLSITLDKSGEATLDINGETNTGNWEETDQGFSLDGELEFVVDGSAATVDYEGVTILFEH